MGVYIPEEIWYVETALVRVGRFDEEVNSLIADSVVTTPPINHICINEISISTSCCMYAQSFGLRALSSTIAAATPS
jgi:hypothetical protein